MKAGSKITLRGEAGCSEPGLAAGDVILIVNPKEHSLFKRVNTDLILQVCLSMREKQGGVVSVCF